MSEKPVVLDLELENAYLKAENSALKAEILVLQTELAALKAEPEFSEGFDETVKKDVLYK